VQYWVGTRILLNNTNRDSSWVEFWDTIEGLVEYRYGYVDYYSNVTIRVGNEARDSFLARIYLQPVEILDPQSGKCLVHLIDPVRAGRRRQRNHIRPHWLWISIEQITRVVGTIKTEMGTYIVKLPWRSGDIDNPAVRYMNEDGNPAI